MRKARVLLACMLMAFAAPAMAQSGAPGGLPRKAAGPVEATPGLETELGVVRTARGVRLRSYLTRPQGASGRLPAILYKQAVSCGSLALPPTSNGALRRLARESGMVMLRVDRSGTGDSEGQPCDALDYDTEVKDYRDALAALAAHPWVDRNRIVVFGSSLGSTTAPLVAAGTKVAGVLVQGAGAVTYLERMIAFDRLQLERSGRFPVAAAATEMPRRIAFQQLYLSGRRPADIARERPELAGVWESLLGTAADNHYGRPFAWHWQAARQDWLSAWAALDAPVMVVYGEWDGFEPRHGHRLIVDTVNRLRPGTADWLEIPRAGHDLRIYATPEAAYTMEGGEAQPDLFVRPAVAWLRRVTGLPPR